jgi:hypothetical protein
MEETSKFAGWAVIELFGHQREAGYVTTEYFGSGALFRVEVPALPEREVQIDHTQWINDQLVPKNSKVLREAVAGRTRFLGPGSIYALNPCSEEAARKAIDALSPRTVKVIELAKERQLVGAPDLDEPSEDDIDEECR